MSERALLAKAAQPTATGADLVAAGVKSTAQARQKLNTMAFKARTPTITKKQIRQLPIPTVTQAPTRQAPARKPASKPGLPTRILTTAPAAPRKPRKQPQQRRRRRRRRPYPRRPIIIREQYSYPQIIPVPFGYPQPTSYFPPSIPRTQAPAPAPAAPIQRVAQEKKAPVSAQSRGLVDQARSNVKKFPLAYAAGALFLLILLLKR